MSRHKWLRAVSKSPVPKHKQPAKLRQGSDASIKAAIQAVHNGELSIRCAAVEHGVPTTTPKDQISGRVQQILAQGPWHIYLLRKKNN